MSKYNIFHRSEASLAEGLYVDNPGKQVLWVDINKSEIYRKSFDGQCYHHISIDAKPSALLSLEGSKLALCISQGLAELNIETGEMMLVSENPETGYDERFRSNDGVSLSGGSVLYGTMESSPTGIHGELYYFDGMNTKALNIPTGIPNGFIRLNDSAVLIADSYTKQVNLFEIDRKRATLQFKRCWHDFSPETFTPDGGCADNSGNVYIALWDGSGIAVLNYEGALIRILELPVLRPTNCKIANDDKLYVTSAREGMTIEQLILYPLSGSVFEIDLI